MRSFFSLFLLAASFGLVSCAREEVPSDQPKIIAIVGATLIDGTPRPPVDRSIVLIEGNKIRNAGFQGDVPVPAGAEKYDASGRFVTPTATGAVVAAGAPADLLIIAGNPLENPFLLAQPVRTMRAGEWTDAARK